MISPSSIGTARMIALLTVVLPEPDSPTRPRHSPRSIVKLTSASASTVGSLPRDSHFRCLRMPKRLVRWRTSSSVPPLRSMSGAPARCSTGVVISRIGFSRSPGFMSKCGTAFSSAFR